MEQYDKVCSWLSFLLIKGIYAYIKLSPEGTQETAKSGNEMCA